MVEKGPSFPGITQPPKNLPRPTPFVIASLSYICSADDPHCKAPAILKATPQRRFISKSKTPVRLPDRALPLDASSTTSQISSLRDLKVFLLRQKGFRIGMGSERDLLRRVGRVSGARARPPNAAGMETGFVRTRCWTLRAGGADRVWQRARRVGAPDPKRRNRSRATASQSSSCSVTSYSLLGGPGESPTR